ncbi:FtsX-like permease family protein [Algoriphagus machipongonensis]|uniref:ABC transporter n=1 Tax=Algoriphagus machipongonensis TaxID=388413 RepID=A3I1M1_9BACT|nr:FtsX-like permease family protein [Algoriphagus machipongonensis]EAZ79687.2 ABC transporter [Algoriphagus machipongonensis]
MWKNYLKVSFRNLQKRKLYTGINLLGLTIAIFSFLAICLYINHEWSYDKMYTDYNRIYRLNQEFRSQGDGQLVSSTPSSLVPTLIEEVPEVENGTLVFDVGIFSTVMIDAGDGNQEENSFAYADENFYKIFDFELLSGDVDRVLAEPNQIVLTKSTAEKYFGTASAAQGSPLKVNNTDFVVSGVMEDFPSNSHLEFDFIGSFKTHRHGINPEWSPSNYYSYIKLKPETDTQVFEGKLSQLVDKYLGEELAEYGYETAFFVQPVSQIHLGDQALGSIKPGTDIRYLYIFGIVALLLIAIGVINYVNLATAEATERNKEVGLRKVMGAGRAQLFGQFVSESFILTLGAAVLSVLALYLFAPKFSSLSGVPLDLNLVISPVGLLLLAGFVAVIGVLAGLYPSMILSGMEPIKALANKAKIGGGAWVRKSLVVFQFFVSIGLLISTFVVKSQLNYMQEVNLGYEKEHLVSLSYHYNMRDGIETIKNEMLRSGAAVSISRAADMPVHIKAGYKVFPGGDNPKEFMITGYSVDRDIINTIDLELIAGDNFTESDPSRSDLEEGTERFPVILNESAIKEMGWTPEEAIGKTINFGFNGNSIIKGVVRDFYFNSLHHQVGPLVIFKDPDQSNVLLVKLASGNPSAHLATLEGVWKDLVAERPFNPVFVDQAYDQMYSSEQKAGMIFGLFSGIAIFIACMGLFGLVSYVALRRTREISIRKVLGATQQNVVIVLASDFLKLLGISAILAIGFGFWFSKQWLQDFANKTDPTFWPYVIAIGIVFTLAMLTIAYRSWKVYSLNPAKTLKSE